MLHQATHALVLGSFLFGSGCSQTETPRTFGPTFASDAAVGPGRDARSVDALFTDAPSSDAPWGRDAMQDAPPDAFIDAEVDAGDASAGCGSSVLLVSGGNAHATGTRITNGVASSVDLGSTLGDVPAFASLGPSTFSVFVNANKSVQAVAMAPSFGPPQTLGTRNARGTPALATLATHVHAVYQASANGADDYKFFHGVLSGGTWNDLGDPVGSPQSFGPSVPHVAALSGELVVVQAGSDGFGYDQRWNASWGAATKHASWEMDNTIAPRVTQVGANLMAVWARAGDRHLTFSILSGGSWSTPLEVSGTPGNVAFSNDPPSLLALANGELLLVYRGGDAKPYYALYIQGTFSPPAPMWTAATTVKHTPSIALGVCGSDALVAYVDSGGSVFTASLSGGVFEAPLPIAGLSNASYVGVTSLP